VAVHGVRIVGLDKLVLEFDLASAQTIAGVEAVVGRGCMNVKRDWQQAWKGFKHLGFLPYTIGYDVFTTPGHIQGEVGPDLNKKQGPLGGVAEFGTPTSAPHPGGAPALDAEAPRFEAAMLALTERLLP
jgi:hypothetical protein